MYIGLHGNFMNIRPMGAEFHADGQTNITNLLAASNSFANAPYNNNSVEWKHSMIFVCTEAARTHVVAWRKPRWNFKSWENRIGAEIWCGHWRQLIHETLLLRGHLLRRFVLYIFELLGPFWWSWQIKEKLKLRDFWNTIFWTTVHDYQRFVGALTLHLRRNPRIFTRSFESPIKTCQSARRHIVEDLIH